jgi:hypothetical protein
VPGQIRQGNLLVRHRWTLNTAAGGCLCRGVDLSKARAAPGRGI